MPSKAKLTPKYRKFAREYVKILAETGEANGAQAAKNAGYSPKTARREAVRILKLQCVKEYIATLSEKTDAIEAKDEEEAQDNLAQAKTMVQEQIDAIKAEIAELKIPPELEKRAQGMKLTHEKVEEWLTPEGQVMRVKNSTETKEIPPDVQAITVKIDMVMKLRRQLLKYLEHQRLLDGGVDAQGTINIYIAKQDMHL
jgi:phage terminase small subunit